MDFLASEVGFKPAQAEVERVTRERPDDIRIRAGLWLWFLIKLGEVFYGTSIVFLPGTPQYLGFLE